MGAIYQCHFNTKKELTKHIDELVKSGYLVENEIQIKQSGSAKYFLSTFTLNFNQIKVNKEKKK